MTKTAKDIIEHLVPEMTKVISVAVSTAVKHAMDQMIDTVKSKTVDSFHIERHALLQKYDCDRLEQYQRSDNLRIYGIEEGIDESEERLEEKVVESASNIGVNLDPRGISVVHRLGKQQESVRPVIVRFCCRKKRNEILKKKKVLKEKKMKVFINEDLTPLRSTMLKMVKEQSGVKNATSRAGKILAWLNDAPNQALQIETPDDLFKVGIVCPDWKRLKMDHLVGETTE